MAEGGILVLVVVVMLVVESILVLVLLVENLVLVVEGHTLRSTGPLLLKPLQLESAASQGGGEEDGEDPGEHQWSAWSTACDHISAALALHNSLLKYQSHTATVGLKLTVPTLRRNRAG